MRSRLVLSALLICYNATAVMAAVVTVPFVPRGLVPGDEYHIMFVTEGARDATSSNIADYNAFVQSEAERSGAITENWGINWFVIGSTSAVDARDNIPVSTEPIYTISNDKVADDANDLWDGTPNIPRTDQFGYEHFDTLFVWTGSDPTGHSLLPLGSPRVMYGATTSVPGEWMQVNTTGSVSSNLNRLYAVSEKLTVVPEPCTLGTCLLLSGLGVLGGFGRRKRR